MTNEKKPDINQKAFALSYTKKDTAPRVVAKGQGYVAQKILENAHNADIPIYEDPQLVEELNKVDLGSNIPPELYEVVAEVLIFISDLDHLEEIKKYDSK